MELKQNVWSEGVDLEADVGVVVGEGLLGLAALVIAPRIESSMANSALEAQSTVNSSRRARVEAPIARVCRNRLHAVESETA